MVNLALCLLGLVVVAGIANTTLAAVKMDKNKLVICIMKMVLLVIARLSRNVLEGFQGSNSL